MLLFHAENYIFFTASLLRQAFFVLSLFFLITPLSKAESSSRENAVALARSGELGEAIKQLEFLLRQEPDNKQIIQDLVVIYSWNGQHGQACSLFEQQKLDSYPDYVLLSVQKTYRDLNQPDQALAIINSLLEKQPDEPELLLFKGLLLVDKLKLKEAETVLDTIRNKTGKDSRYYQLSGYIHTTQKKWIAALADYQQLRVLQPHAQEPILEQFSILQHLRAGKAASDILSRHAQTFTDHDREKNLMNQSVTRLRWAKHASRDFKEASLLSMQALALQIKALDLLNRGAEKKSWPASRINDLVITLHNLGQMDDVELVYRYLTKQPGEVPKYVQLAAADAMLTNRQPEKSRKLYQQILKNDPRSYEALIGLFYSFVEEEEFDSAYRLLDKSVKNEPLLRDPTNKKIRPYNPHNARYLDSNVYKIMARLYGDQLKDAWESIDELVRNGPTNTWLREIRGQVANARGWPRQALNDYHYALLLEPDNVDIAAGKASILIQQKQYRQAGSLQELIRQNYPDEEAVDMLEKESRVGRKPMGWVEIVYNSTSNSEVNGDSMVSTVDILSSPINDNLYIEAFYRNAWEKLQEVEETFKYYSLSLDYRLMDWEFGGKIAYNDSSTDGFGGSVTITWTPDDFWTLNLSGERFSVNTPLSGLAQGIREDILAAEASYRWSEQSSLSVGVDGTFFTDNNKGLAGTIALTQRLVDTSRIDLDGTVEFYGSVNNNGGDAPYFLPEQDFSMKSILHLDHTYFRHHDDLLQQQIEFVYGTYGQKGYDPSWIGYIRYEHVYEHTPWMEIVAGVELGRNVYDGGPEYHRQVRCMLNWKF